MNHFKIKIQEVFLPYLIVAISTIISYNGLRWYLDIQLDILPLKDDLLNFGLPFFIPWIPILIWLRRRVRILQVNRSNDNGYFFYQFAMVGAMAITIMVSQNYIEKASYDLIELNTIDQVADYPKEKYFVINNFDVHREGCQQYATSRTSGEYNTDLNFYLYFPCPFKRTNAIWYGVAYKKHLSNQLSDEGKNAAYRDFILASENKLKIYYFKSARYFEKLRYSDSRDGYLEAINNNTDNSSIENSAEEEQIILVPHLEAFSNNRATALQQILSSFLISSLILFGMIIYPKVDQKELRDFRKNKPLKEDDLRDFLAFLNPRGAFPATAILILLNSLVFFIMVAYGINMLSPSPKELLELGGNRRSEVLNGEVWRLLSAVFIHGGIFHLLMNMVGLGISGSFLEKTIGSMKLIGCFLLCGFCASMVSLYWHENTVIVGASGAIFGIFGLILSFNVFKIFPADMRFLSWLLIGLYAGTSLVFGFISNGIDNAAHIGGIASGFILGSLLIVFKCIEKES